MKKLFALLLSLVLLASLAACGGKDAPPQENGGPAPSGEQEPAGDPSPDPSGEPEPAGDSGPLLPDPESTGSDLEDLGEGADNPRTVQASHSDVTLRTAGETFRLSVLGLEGVYACSFVSDSPEVASVDEATGDVTALSPGTATVSMHVEGDGGQYDFDCTVRCVWTVEEENILASLPEWFDFSSGAGAWSTELKIAADGTFNGLFTDANAGESGEGYVATIYTCQFYGEFSAPVKVNDYTYSMTLESLHLVDEAGQETIDEDGVRYVTSTPYGLEGADEVLIYLPGAPTADLPEEFVNWVRNYFWDWNEDEGDTLPRYGLYNVNEGLGFAGVG